MCTLAIAVCLNMRVINPMTVSVAPECGSLINFSHSSKLEFNSYVGENNNVQKYSIKMTAINVIMNHVLFLYIKNTYIYITSQRYQCVRLKTSVWRQVRHMFVLMTESNDQVWEKSKPFANTINQTVAAFSYKGTFSKVKNKNLRKNLNKIKILSKNRNNAQQQKYIWQQSI